MAAVDFVRPVLHNVEGRPLMKFRLNIGECACVNKLGETRYYREGQRIETPTNLTKRFGREKFTRLSDGDMVDEGQLFAAEITDQDLNAINADDTGEFRERMPVAADEDEGSDDHDQFDPSASSTLTAMELSELFKLAKDEEIPLGTAKTKKAVIAKIDAFHRGGSL